MRHAPRLTAVTLSAVEHGPREHPRIALSFDDGPGRITHPVLDVLEHHAVRATFNVLGERAAQHEQLLVRTLAAGHELGSHAFHHQPLARRPREAYRQLRRTNAALRAAVGITPRVFRPPYGSVSPTVVLAARAAGLVTVGWDVDPHDYATQEADVIRDAIVREARPGSIVVLHDDRRAREQTAVALDGALPELRERGLECVTVSELLGLGRCPRKDSNLQPRG